MGRIFAAALVAALGACGLLVLRMLQLGEEFAARALPLTSLLGLGGFLGSVAAFSLTRWIAGRHGARAGIGFAAVALLPLLLLGAGVAIMTYDRLLLGHVEEDISDPSWWHDGLVSPISGALFFAGSAARYFLSWPLGVVALIGAGLAAWILRR